MFQRQDYKEASTVLLGLFVWHWKKKLVEDITENLESRHILESNVDINSTYHVFFLSDHMRHSNWLTTQGKRSNFMIYNHNCKAENNEISTSPHCPKFKNWSSVSFKVNGSCFLVLSIFFSSTVPFEVWRKYFGFYTD